MSIEKINRRCAAFLIQNCGTANGSPQPRNDNPERFKMAHELYTQQNGKTAMAFVGETPWHGLGQRLTLDASTDQWIAEGGFDWQALTAPVQFTDANGIIRPMNDKQVIYRSDTGAPLSVMGDGYKCVQPREVIEFFRDLAALGGWKLHTAGVMKGGAKMWAMASNADARAEVVPGDVVRGNLLLATSLDGSTPTIAGLTSVRVVCANTLRLALGKNGEQLKGARGGFDAVRVTHRSVFNADTVRAQLGLTADMFAAHIAQAQELAARSVTMEQARDILRQIFGAPIQRKAPGADDAAAAAANVIARMTGKGAAPMIDAREQKSVARALDLFAGAGRGANHAGVAGTAWGLLNAITEHVDHEQGRSATRLESAWFGRGQDFKSTALELLTA